MKAYSKTNSVKKNYLYSSLYQILLIVLPLITAPHIARVLGSDGVGIYSYTYSVSSCFAMFGMLGVTSYGSRIISSNRDDKYKTSELFFDIWTIQLILTLTVTVIYFIYIFTMSNLLYRDALIFQTLVILCSFVDISWFFFGMEEFKITVTRNILVKLFATFAILFFVKTKNDLNLYIFILWGGTLLGQLSIFPFLKRYVYYVKPSLMRMREHIKPLLALFIPVLSINLFRKMDKIMLGQISTMSQLGYYTNAERIVLIPLGLITALGSVILPKMSYLISKNDTTQINRYMNLTFEFTIFLSYALMFGLIAVSNEFIPLFYGNGYEGAIGILQLLSITVFFNALSNMIRSVYLIPKNYDKVYIISISVSTIINLILNYFLIPDYGAIGATIATIISEILSVIIQVIYIYKELPIHKYILKNMYYLFDGIIMLVIVRLISMFINGWVGIIIEVFIGMISYLLVASPYILSKHNNEIMIEVKKIGNKDGITS